ncbi:hypothetical protein HD_1653 [[Haemophilus] ducreyi 35000HP]|uniref:Uncharacterized protein n=1 Tax=Haemophilus ducreyi (strain 35000HP / ATCC 700724) TaxID=233412 RepID=Q7VL32_HAEDU|nr:hypothetical protein HD_1653 [[Haemophilus] ducreyi 35000HP]
MNLTNYSILAEGAVSFANILLKPTAFVYHFVTHIYKWRAKITKHISLI